MPDEAGLRKLDGNSLTIVLDNRQTTIGEPGEA
jgi:hypothetical protein